MVEPQYRCVYCSKDTRLHIGLDYTDSGCTYIDRVSKMSESAAVIVNESNEATVNAVEETLQSLLIVVRSLGLDPAQFLQRAIERANREAKTLDANQKFRDRFAGFVVETEHRHNQAGGSERVKSERIAEAAKRAGEALLHDSWFDESVRGDDRVRSQVETADAIQRSNEGKNQVPDMRWYEAWDAVKKEREDEGN